MLLCERILGLLYHSILLHMEHKNVPEIEIIIKYVIFTTCIRRVSSLSGAHLLSDV